MQFCSTRKDNVLSGTRFIIGMVGCSYPFLADKFLESLLFTAMTDSWVFCPFCWPIHILVESEHCYLPLDTPHTLSDLEFAKQQGQQCDYGETSAACCSKLLSVMPPPCGLHCSETAELICRGATAAAPCHPIEECARATKGRRDEHFPHMKTE